MRASIVALLVFALDRWTKHLVEITMQPYQSHTVIPGLFDIVRTNNTGVAFGLFAGSESPYRIWILLLFSVGALAALGWVLWRNRATDPYNSMAMAFIFGGAVGNVFDRLRAGSVTDFLDFYHGGYHWYTFNVADTAISIGAGLLLLGMLRRAPAQRKVLS